MLEGTTRRPSAVVMTTTSRSPTEKQPRIDLICRITDAEIILSVRDDGEAFDPATVEDTEEEFTNLKMIKTLADKVSYTRALGLNNMLIKIGRK